MQPARLSKELRQGTGPSLDRRRRILALTLTSAGSMGLISLYQMGVLRHIPEPPLPRLDADRVDASEEAYEKLQSPDAAIGFASYAVTALLAAAGEPARARTQPWLPLAMAAKIGFDAAQAAKLSWDQWARHRAFCSWCLLAAGATFATVPLAVAEVRETLHQWKQGG